MLEVPSSVPFPIHIFDRGNFRYHTFFYVGLTLPSPEENFAYNAVNPVQFYNITESGIVEPILPDSPPRRRRRWLENLRPRPRREE